MNNNNDPVSIEGQNLKPGKYRHFKGGVYTILGVARHSEDPTQEFVVYDHDGKFWIRPLKMFLEKVERDEYSGPRFTYLGE